MNERDVEISKRDAKKKERRSRKDKLAIEHTSLRFMTPYIDPAVAVVMALLLIKEPVCEIFQSIKNLILFAPEEETLSQIRAIVD